MAERLRVCIEVGTRRVFATALDWPGWCRGAKGELGAVDQLLAYAERYAAAIARTRMQLPGVVEPEIVERLTGGSGTDFGAPNAPARDESRATSAADGERLASLLTACWATFDDVVAGAPEALRKGPRGGGRDRTRIVEHVLEAERAAYARRLGVRHAPFAVDDEAARDRLRAGMLAVIRTPSNGEPVVDRGWSVRFAVRYIAWHVLDHAWEIEDRRA